MSQFIRLPPERLDKETLQALLEEYASRDGTDYGEYEYSLDQKVQQLGQQLAEGALWLLYDTDAETWDLWPEDQARSLVA